MKAYNGIIFKVTKDYSIVLSDTGLFHAIKNRGQMTVSQKVTYTDYDRIYLHKKRIFSQFHSNTVVAASLLLMFFIGAYSYLTYTTAYAVVSLDMNSSMELYLNKQMKVTKVKGHNPEGERILKDIKKGTPLKQAVEAITIQACNQAEFTAENNGVFVASTILKPSKTLKTEEINQEVYQVISKVSTKNITVYSMSVEQLDITAASEANLSIGMYELSLRYKGVIDIQKEHSLNAFMQTLFNTYKQEDIPIKKQTITPIMIDKNEDRLKNRQSNEVQDKTVQDKTVQDKLDISTGEKVNGELKDTTKDFLEKVEITATSEPTSDDIEDVLIDTTKEEIKKITTEQVDKINENITDESVKKIITDLKDIGLEELFDEMD